MSSLPCPAPELAGPLTEESPAEHWSAAARCTEPFVYVVEDDEGHETGRHLMAWQPAPRRAHGTGVTGSARVLASCPDTGSLASEVLLRIHVCRQRPCPAKKNHPSKYGTTPCPQEHGRILAWGRAAWHAPVVTDIIDIPVIAEENCPDAAAVVASTGAVVALPAVPGPASDEGVAAGILRRATEMRAAGSYIGLWEILCWCGMRQSPCKLLLAEGLVDVVAAFAPDVIVHPCLRGPCANVLVGCRGDEHDDGPHPVWIPSGMAGLSHLIAGLAMGSAMACTGCSVRDHCLRHGFAPVMTVANGDCGIDAMLVIAGAPRKAPDRQRLRNELHDFMTAKATDMTWQTAFLSLQEHDPPVREAIASASHELVEGAAAADAAGDVTGDADAQEPPLPPPPAHPGDDATARLRAAVAWASGGARLPMECVYRIASLLTAEQASALVERHGQHEEEGPRTPRPKKSLSRALCGIKSGTRTLKSKLQDASCVLAWIGAQGLHLSDKLPRCTWKRFWQDHGAKLTKAEETRGRVYIRRCIRLAESQTAELRASTYEPAGRRNVRFRERRRLHGTQGRPSKASLVREQLFQWFCSIRRSVKTRLPARAVLQQAKVLTENYVYQCVVAGKRAEAPALTPSWLRDWCMCYRVSLRKPNRRCEVPKAILQERLRIMWCNVMRVRELARRILGYDLAVDNVDQSPFHMNEAGSKDVGSLCLRGCGAVPLNEVHSATRARWTVNTMVRSDVTPAGPLPPLEIMFKAEGSRLQSDLQQHIPRWAPWLSVVTSPSGSYQEPDLLDYLERVYPLPLQPRQRWRILLLDAYAPHQTERVRRCAWQRRVIIVIHGGGTTSVGQVNDTDLHKPMKKEYIELEMDDALRQAALGKACPMVRREDAMAWMSIVWFQTHMHLQAADGFKKVGITNALDGSEDDLVCREARSYWNALSMPEMRASAVADVDCEVDAGRLSWTYRHVYRLIAEHPARGHVDFHPDDEGSDEDPTDTLDPTAWTDSDDDAAPTDEAAEGVRRSGSRHASAVAEEESAPQGLCNEMYDRTARLDTLRTVLLQVEQAGVEAVANTVRRAIHAEQKAMKDVARSCVPVRRAFAEAEEEAERRALQERAVVERRVAESARAKRTLKELLREQEALQVRKAELARASSVEESLRALKRWTAADFGQGHPGGGTRAHAANRREVLERLRRRAPALPPDLANDWGFFLRTWDTRRVSMLPEWQRAGWGSRFLNMMLELHRDMRAHPEGDAFALWIRREMSWEHFPGAPLRV